jgi:CspA family cold shock protein
MEKTGAATFTGKITWFDVKKQFGFIKVPGLRDTFLHMKVLKAAGYVFVPAGTTVRFTVDKSDGKPRVAELLAVDTSTAEPGQPEAVRRKAQAGNSN